MTALVEVTVAVEGEDVTVTLEPGPRGTAALATLLDGGCPICSAALAPDGACASCAEEGGRAIRFRAVADDGRGAA